MKQEGIKTMTLSRRSAICGLGLCAVLLAVPAKGEITARDIRSEMRTRWDYQPGQGPKRYARDRDYFSPSQTSGVETLAPNPPVVPGDYKDPPRAEDRLPVPMPSNEPATKTSVLAGLDVAYGDYHEKTGDTSLTGPSFAATLQGTHAFAGAWFVRGDTRFAYAVKDYSGAGSQDGGQALSFEAQSVVGYDLLRGRFGLSPFIGLGYRYLSTDLTSPSAFGVAGYGRHNHYAFTPVGLDARLTMLDGRRLSFTGSFNPLWKGWTSSRLSELGEAYPDLRMQNGLAYGLRGEVQYEIGDWSVGPFAEYWNLGRSSVKCGTGTGAGAVTVCGSEPHNTSFDAGLRLRYRLY